MTSLQKLKTSVAKKSLANILEPLNEPSTFERLMPVSHSLPDNELLVVSLPENANQNLSITDYKLSTDNKRQNDDNLFISNATELIKQNNDGLCNPEDTTNTFNLTSDNNTTSKPPLVLNSGRIDQTKSQVSQSSKIPKKSHSNFCIFCKEIKTKFANHSIIRHNNGSEVRNFMYLKKECEICLQRLNVEKKEFDRAAWLYLQELTLTYIQLFNRRRVREIKRLTVDNYKKKEYARQFIRITLQGKLSRTVSLLLTPFMTTCIECILHFRQAAGVKAENKLIFAKPGDNDFCKDSSGFVH